MGPGGGLSWRERRPDQPFPQLDDPSRQASGPNRCSSSRPCEPVQTPIDAVPALRAISRS